MDQNTWLKIGGGLLAAVCLTGLTGCQKSISAVADLVIKIGPETKMRLVYIPALKQYVGKYEVSNKEYRCFKPTHSSGVHHEQTLNLHDQPAVMVSWLDARNFCEWLTKNYGHHGNRHYVFRLPTEQEWETFAACGQAAEFPWGAGAIPKNWNYFGRENPEPGQKLDRNDKHRVACPVKQSGANAWGLYGVGGNVWEWCADTDGQSKSRIYKGASWSDCHPQFLKINRRSSNVPDYRYVNLGFRVVAQAADSEQPKK